MEQVLFISIWIAQETYIKGELVIGSNGRVYQSQIGSNQGNDPVLGVGTQWQILLQSGEVANTTGLDINKEDAGTGEIRFINNTFQRWGVLFDTDESLKLNLHDSGGAFDKTVFRFSVGDGSLISASNITNTGTFENIGNVSIAPGLLTIDQDTQAATAEMRLTSDTSQQALISFQDATIDRWVLGQNVANSFLLTSFDAGGLNPQTILAVDNNSLNLQLRGNLQFQNTNQGLDVISTSGGVLNFNFPSLSLNTENTAFDYFDDTNTSGNRFINVYQGNGTATITYQIDAETGSIHPALDRAGEADPGVKLNKITLSTNAPVGGEDGDLWLRY